MRRVIGAELRDSWSAWLGVSLGFVMTGFSLALAALVLHSAVAAAGVVPENALSAYSFISGTNLVLATVVGLSVVGSSTSLVVDSRRGALARLALAGAAPGTVVGTVLSQLAAVAVASALVADLLAVAALRPALHYLLIERAADGGGIAVPPVAQPGTLVVVNLAWLLVVLLGGWRQARRASRIPPVEALRQAQGSETVRRRGVGRWFRAGFAGLLLIGMFAVVPVLAANRDSETFTQIMQLNLLGLVVVGWLLAELMPVIVRPLTAFWTAAIPASVSPSWWVARATVLARAERLARSTTPVMFTIGLGFGVLGLPATYNAIFAAAGFDVQLEHVGADTFLVNLGLALGIALCGSVGSLFMMSKQRDAELALLGIAGATPAQRNSAAVLEAVIVTGTAAVLGLVMVGFSFAYLAYATPATGLPFALDVPLLPFAVALLVTGGITVAATALPTLAARRLPEPRVVARLIAE
ncbi:MAG: hypothetical protein QM804_14620 [Propionicimonas sp.]